MLSLFICCRTPSLNMENWEPIRAPPMPRNESLNRGWGRGRRPRREDKPEGLSPMMAMIPPAFRLELPNAAADKDQVMQGEIAKDDAPRKSQDIQIVDKVSSIDPLVVGKSTQQFQAVEDAPKKRHSPTLFEDLVHPVREMLMQGHKTKENAPDASPSPSPVTDTFAPNQNSDGNPETAAENQVHLTGLCTDEFPFGCPVTESRPKLTECMKPSVSDQKGTENTKTNEQFQLNLSLEDIHELERLLGITPPTSTETDTAPIKSPELELKNKPYRFRKEDIKVYLTHKESIRQKLNDWVMIFQYMRKDMSICKEELLREMGRVDAIVQLKEDASRNERRK